MRHIGGGDRTWLVLAVMLCVLLAPVWAFDYFPSADGPSHLANALILRDYHDASSEAYRDYYTLLHEPAPNWFAPLLLAGLTFVLPPLLAEKVLLSAIVVGLPLAMAYVIHGVNRRSLWLALLSLPLVYSYVLYMGFHNFLFSVIFLLVLLGWWWRRRVTLSARHVPMLAGLSLLVYFSHPIGAALAGLILLGWAIWLSLIAGRRGLGRAAWTAAGLLQAGVLLAWFVFASDVGDGASQRMGLVESARRLVTLDVMISHDLRELAPALVMVALLSVCGVWALRRRWRGGRSARPRDAVALTLPALVVVYFIAPEQTAGGGFITARLVLVVALASILWLATATYPRWWHRVAGGVAVLMTITLLAMHWPVFVRVNHLASTFADVAPHIDRDAIVLPLNFAEHGATPDGERVSRRVRLFDHLAAYATLRRDAVNLYNYEAKTGYFPVRFRPERNPFEHLWQRVRPPRVRLSHYHTHTPATADYLLVWGSERDVASANVGVPIEAYELVYRCPRTGDLLLYERRAQARTSDRRDATAVLR